MRTDANNPVEGQSRQDRRARKTQMKIAEAARAVISEKGLEATTVDDITERADLGRGTFYYHFANKDALVKDLIDDVMTGLIGEIKSHCDKNADLASVMNGMIQAHTNYFGERWEDFVLYYQGRADLTLEQSYDGLESSYMNYIETIERVVSFALKDKVPNDVLRRVAFAIGGFISGYYSFASIANSAEEVEQSFLGLRNAFVKALVRFIRVAMPSEE
jgi:AcrR family transcriptional regulator